MRFYSFVLFLSTTILYPIIGQSQPIKSNKTIIIMLDGFGVDYYRGAKMPTLNAIERNGIYREVHSLMPSVTNLNNVAICTGNFPSVNGITGNSYFKTVTNTEEFMEDPQLIMAPTIFQKAKKLGIESIIFASKKKTIGLLYKDTKDTVSPETASSYWINRVGRPAPSIYSREVNYWLMDAALYSIQHDTNVNLFYIHPTDYPMHTWSAESEEATTYLNTMDGYIKKIIELVPNATVLLTADHTVSHKSLCWDLNKACLNRNTPIKIAISPERDKYFIHHRGFGGTAYVYLNNPNDLLSVKNILAHLKGVDEVLTRDEAAKRFHLMADRIGDLVVLGDQTTVFGDLDAESEVLPATYRSHGSTYDTSVPLFIHNGKNVPPAATFQYNFQITPWLFRQ